MSLDPSIELGSPDQIIYGVSFQSTRIGNTVTGFSLRVDGRGDLPKALSASNGSNKGILGDVNGITSSIGQTKSRTSIADSIMVSDPFGAFLQKTIIMSRATLGKGINRGIPLGSTSRKENFLYTVTSDKYTDAMFMYMSGDIKGFFSIMTGFESDSGFKLIFPDETMSPIVKALSEPSGSGVAKRQMNTYKDSMAPRGEVMSVGSIIETFLKPLGLEIFYEGNSTYACRQPKILQAPDVTKWEVFDDDIISISSVTNPNSAPDIVIPSYVAEEFIGKNNDTAIAQEGLENLLRSQSGHGGSGGYIKVKTFRAESLFAQLNDLVKIDILLDGENKEDGVSPVKTTNSSFEHTLRMFTTNLAMASSYQSIMTGSITMDFNPSISHGYEWITYKDEKFFIGDVRHEVSRGRAITVLSIAAKEADFKVINSVAAGESVKNQSEKFNQTQEEKIKKNEDEASSMALAMDLRKKKNRLKKIQKHLTGAPALAADTVKWIKDRLNG